MQLYVDQDGVLADFDSHYQTLFGSSPNKLQDKVDWRRIQSCPDFFATIRPMSDLPELWSFLKPLDPIVLTGVPVSLRETAAEQKRAWSRRHLGEDVEIICCLSREKATFAKPGDILIDDWEKYKHLWVEAGGIWVTHRSAAQTIQQLQDIGTELGIEYLRNNVRS